MSEFLFFNLAISQWMLLLALSVVTMGMVWLSLRKYLVAGVYDPLFFVLGVAYGINYAIVLLLLVNDLITLPLFMIIAFYGISLVVVFRWVSSGRSSDLLRGGIRLFAPAHLGGAVFSGALVIYFSLSAVLVSTIGFGLFAETNRFDVARGYGSIIRVLDCLSPFIVSYLTLLSMKHRNVRLLIWSVLALFILFSAVINGAKVSVLFSFITIILTMFIANPKFKIATWKVAIFFVVGLSFSALALKINLDNNYVVDRADAPLAGVSNMVVARLIYRIIAFGDTSYLVLPNNVIDHLQTDSLLARFAAPIVGNTNLSAMLGYDVSNYTVGRQAVLFQTADTAVFGGPTSHFDYFAYVYFGPVGGWFFVVAIALLLGFINKFMRLIKDDAVSRDNNFLVALIAAVWTRAVLVLVEPAVGLAYILDAAILFSCLSFLCALFVSPRRSAGAKHPVV